MKTLLLTLFVALMLGISCSSSLGKVSVNEPKQDTVVRSVRDRSGWYCEFFVVKYPEIHRSMIRLYVLSMTGQRKIMSSLSSRNKILPHIHTFSILMTCLTV